MALWTVPNKDDATPDSSVVSENSIASNFGTDVADGTSKLSTDPYFSVDKVERDFATEDNNVPDDWNN
jgi:hypothetical protein